MLTVRQEWISPTLLLTCRRNVQASPWFQPSAAVEQTCPDIYSPLVSMSAIISSVGQYFSSTVPLLTCSQMKWYFIPMCLARPWNCGFFAIQITDWLSSRITVGPVGLFLKLVTSCRIQIASCAALANAMYSASAVDSALATLQWGPQQLCQFFPTAAPAWPTWCGELWTLQATVHACFQPWSSHLLCNPTAASPLWTPTQELVSA